MAEAAWFVYRHLGLSGAGLIFLLEGLGAPVPVEIPLGIIGLRMAHGLNSYWQMVLLMWLSTAAGNSLGYLVGYYGGRPVVLKMLAWFHIKEETWQRVDAWFRTHGLKTVLATRWINWGFAQNMWLCGITRVPFLRFLAVMTVNDFFWAMAWSWLSRTAATYFQSHSAHFRQALGHFLRESATHIGATAVCMFLLGVAFYFLFQWWKNRRPAAGK